MESVTTGTFLNGRIQVIQPRHGYRFSIDAVILSHHVEPGHKEKLLDLGTGVGIIPLMLSHRHEKIQIFGIELQPELAQLAMRNVKKNHLANRISIRCGNMKSMDTAWMDGPVDWVICNPPYRKSQSGRINPDHQKAIARHEISVNLSEVVGTAVRVLRVGGNFATIYPAERLTDLITIMRSVGIEPKRLRVIHSRKNTEAKLILVIGKKGGRPGVGIAAPLIIYTSTGNYTKEVKAMVGP